MAACCRAVWHLLTDADSRYGVEVAEQFADGLVDEAVRLAAAIRAAGAYRDANTRAEYESIFTLPLAEGDDPFWQTAHNAALGAALEASGRARLAVATEFRNRWRNTAEESWTPLFTRAWGCTRDDEHARQCQLFRDIHGHLVLPVALDPAWLARNEGAASKLALGIYQERAFDRLPVLADALEEVGCADSAIVDHLRGPGPHTRGCWVLDAILAKG